MKHYDKYLNFADEFPVYEPKIEKVEEKIDARALELE